MTCKPLQFFTSDFGKDFLALDGNRPGAFVFECRKSFKTQRTDWLTEMAIRSDIEKESWNI